MGKKIANAAGLTVMLLLIAALGAYALWGEKLQEWVRESKPEEAERIPIENYIRFIHREMQTETIEELCYGVHEGYGFYYLEQGLCEGYDSIGVSHFYQLLNEKALEVFPEKRTVEDAFIFRKKKYILNFDIYAWKGSRPYCKNRGGNKVAPAYKDSLIWAFEDSDCILYDMEEEKVIDVLAKHIPTGKKPFVPIISPDGSKVLILWIYDSADDSTLGIGCYDAEKDTWFLLDEKVTFYNLNSVRFLDEDTVEFSLWEKDENGLEIAGTKEIWYYSLTERKLCRNLSEAVRSYYGKDKAVYTIKREEDGFWLVTSAGKKILLEGLDKNGYYIFMLNSAKDKMAVVGNKDVEKYDTEFRDFGMVDLEREIFVMVRQDYRYGDNAAACWVDSRRFQIKVPDYCHVYECKE